MQIRKASLLDFFISGKFKYFSLVCCSGKSNYFINQTNKEALKLCTENENLFLMTLQKKKHWSRGAIWGMVEASPALFSKSKKFPDLEKKMPSLIVSMASISHSKCRFWEKKLRNLLLRGLSFVCCRWNVYRSPFIPKTFGALTNSRLHPC